MLSGLIIHGRRVDVPGVKVVTWEDDPRLALSSRTSRPRKQFPISIIVHSESGDDPHDVVTGRADDYDHGSRLADIDESDARAGHPHSQHLDVAADGTVYQFADMADVVTYQATTANERSIGIELHDPVIGGQWSGGDPVGRALHAFYVDQLNAFVALMDVITRELVIQRQVPRAYKGPIDRLAYGRVPGIYGHRDQTGERGAGDPGDAPMDALAAAGYERTSYEKGEDVQRWAERQRGLVQLGAHIDADGLSGPATAAAIREYSSSATPGRQRTGLWITRPGD